MKPINFDGANVVYGKDQPQYLPLPAQKINNDYGQVITCWELTEDEKKKVIETGQIFLSMLTFGAPLQPILLTAEHPGEYECPNE